MFPPAQPKADPKSFERIPINTLVDGIIEEVMYEESRIFKGYKGAPDKAYPAIRLKFAIEGLKFPHYSKWLKFTYGEKSNLYKNILLPLVEGIKPDAKFDLDHLKGMKVKTLWEDNGDWQNLKVIVPGDSKLIYTQEQAAEPLPF